MSFDKRIAHLLSLSLDPDGVEEETVKTASEATDESLADELQKLADEIEKLAALPFLVSYEAAQKATARSVDDTNSPIGDIIAYKQKHPGTEHANAMRFAKKGNDEGEMSAADKIRQAVIAKLQANGVGTVEKASATEIESEKVAETETKETPEVTEVTGTLKKVASALQALADRTRQLEAEKVAQDDELSKHQRRQTAAGIAKVASEQGFIDEDDQDSYIQSLLDDNELDLDAQLEKVASATPRIPLGTVTDRSEEASSAESRLVGRLSRNA